MAESLSMRGTGRRNTALSSRLGALFTFSCPLFTPPTALLQGGRATLTRGHLRETHPHMSETSATPVRISPCNRRRARLLGAVPCLSAVLAPSSRSAMQQMLHHAALLGNRPTMRGSDHWSRPPRVRVNGRYASCCLIRMTRRRTRRARALTSQVPHMYVAHSLSLRPTTQPHNNLS